MKIFDVPGRAIRWYFCHKMTPGEILSVVVLGFVLALAWRIWIVWKIMNTPTWWT